MIYVLGWTDHIKHLSVDFKIVHIYKIYKSSNIQPFIQAHLENDGHFLMKILHHIALFKLLVSTCVTSCYAIMDIHCLKWVLHP